MRGVIMSKGAPRPPTALATGVPAVCGDDRHRRRAVHGDDAQR
jgi:hypothetical protein